MIDGTMIDGTMIGETPLIGVRAVLGASSGDASMRSVPLPTVAAVVRRLAPLAVLALVEAGCAPSGPLSIGWRFVDGRSCAESGASEVALSGPLQCPTCVFPCPQGESGTVIATVTGAGTITATALSADASVLYQGTLAAGAASPATVVLYVSQ